MKNLLTAIVVIAFVAACKNPTISPRAEAENLSINQESDKALFAAAYDGDIAAVKRAIAAGANVNAKGKDNWTPLHDAARNGHKEVVELLVLRGAEADAKDSNEWTPAQSAMRNGHLEIADLLRKQIDESGEN